jgi:KDO2-lipid IV(A) lauroyltransferase
LNWLKGATALLLVRFLSILPLGVARQMAHGVAGVAWRMNIRAARTTRINLRLCFPELNDDERAVLGRKSLEETAKLVAELGMLFHWPKTRWLPLISVRGDQHIRAATADGRGVLILLPHFGNWECMALYLGALAGIGLYDPPRLGPVGAALHRARERSGSTLLPIDRGGLRSFYKALAEGGITGVLPDQVPDRAAGVYAPFFRQPALTMTFVHRLIQRMRPRVLIGTATRTASGFQIEFAIVAEDVYAPEADACAAAMNRAIEQVVRADPAQYQWEYKRFRRPPPGTADPYRTPV